MNNLVFIEQIARLQGKHLYVVLLENAKFSSIRILSILIYILTSHIGESQFPRCFAN